MRFAKDDEAVVRLKDVFGWARDDDGARLFGVVRIGAADAEDGHARLIAEVGIGQSFAAAIFGDDNFGNGIAIGDFEEIDDGMIGDGACEAVGAVAIGIDHGIGPDAAQDTAMQFACRFGDDHLDAKFLTIRGRHNGRFHIRANRDDGDIALAKAGFGKDVRLRGIALQGGRELARVLHGRAIPINEQNFGSGIRQRFGERHSKPACTNNSNTFHVNSILRASAMRCCE